MAPDDLDQPIILSGLGSGPVHMSSDAPQRPSVMEVFYLLVVLLAFGAIHFLLPNTQEHMYSARITPQIVYRFNADSPTYARTVVKFPEGLYDTEQGRTRILRPLYATLGWVVYTPLRLFHGAVPKSLSQSVSRMLIRANHPEIWQGMDSRNIVLAWAALIVVNVLLSWAGLLLVFRALSALFERRIALTLALLPAAHQSSVDFLFVPAAESFNLLIPAVFLYAAAVTWSRGRPGPVVSVVMGVLMLGKAIAYPFVSWLYEHIWRPRRAPPGEDVGGGAKWMIPALVAGPGLLYLLLLWACDLSIYSHAAQGYSRQFLWMSDYAREGRMLDIPVRWATGLWQHLGYALQTFWVPGAVVLFLLFKRRLHPEPMVPAGLRRHLILYAVAGVAFWCMAGYFQPRLTMTHFPALLVLLGAATVTRSRHPNRWISACVFLSLAWHAIELYRLPFA